MTTFILVSLQCASWKVRPRPWLLLSQTTDTTRLITLNAWNSARPGMTVTECSSFLTRVLASWRSCPSRMSRRTSFWGWRYASLLSRGKMGEDLFNAQWLVTVDRSEMNGLGFSVHYLIPIKNNCPTKPTSLLRCCPTWIAKLMCKCETKWQSLGQHKP